MHATDSTRALSPIRISLWLPLVIALCLITDGVIRFLPIDALCFQAWECVSRYQEPGSIFEANRQFRSDRTHGNMSNMGNLPQEQVVRPQVFTTDRFGFRNASAVAEGTVPVVMVGDSFVAGYGISDDETLPVQLSSLAGVTVYNAGGPYAYADTIRLMRSRLTPAPSEAVIVWSESEPIEQLREAEALAMRPNAQTRAFSMVFGRAGPKVREAVRGWWLTSPAKIVTQKAFLALSNDRILPNVYASLVTRRVLQNGASMLFLPSDVEPFHRHRDVEPAREYLQALVSRIRATGVTVRVALVPHKYSVYYPLLDGTPPVPGDRIHPLAQLAMELRNDGIDAVDLTPSLRNEARDAFASGRYLYWRDDTHWNREGVRVAAEALKRAWWPGADASR